MQRLLERLDRRLTWSLIRPLATHARGQSEPHPPLLQRVLEMRALVGLAPEAHEPRYAFSAAGAWHLIATDALGDVAGAVRVYVVDRHVERMEPADIPHLSHASFPSAQLREQHMTVLRRLFDEKASERYFTAPGGMFTMPAWRGWGLAAALGVAAIAIARLHSSRLSAAYTAVRGQAQDFFTSFGGAVPALPDGQPLAPFFSAHHGFEVQLLIFDSQSPGPRAEEGVQLLMQRLQALMRPQEEMA